MEDPKHISNLERIIATRTSHPACNKMANYYYNYYCHKLFSI